MKKIKTILVLLTMVLSASMYAQNFRPSDLDGTWKRGDGMKINIKGTSTFSEGSDALVVDVGNSGWPQSARMVAFKFRNLKYVESYIWKGVNYMHMPQGNYRKEDGKVTIVMAEDKQSFNANGTTYVRQ